MLERVCLTTCMIVMAAMGAFWKCPEDEADDSLPIGATSGRAARQMPTSADELGGFDAQENLRWMNLRLSSACWLELPAYPTGAFLILGSQPNVACDLRVEDGGEIARQTVFHVQVPFFELRNTELSREPVGRE